MPPSTKRRLLFLHGMFCPPEGYQVDLMPLLLKKLKEHDFDVTFAKSERKTNSKPPMDVGSVMPSIKGRAALPEWYNARDIEGGQKVLDGLPGTIDQLRIFLQMKEPFDVVMGHSQGAQLAAILTLMNESDNEDEWLPASKHWKAVVCMNAPNPFDNEVELCDRVKAHGKIHTASLHVYGGEEDTTNAGARAMRKVHFGDNAWEISHDEGHFPPKNDKVCDEIVDAINSMLLTHHAGAAFDRQGVHSQ